jgi:hypothetical protein
MERMRIDLDGVPLKDPNGRVLCIFRFRTVEGLVFALPESVDVTVPWSAIKQANLDLMSGQISVSFHPSAPERPGWLGEFNTVEGHWTDRALLAEPPRK